MESKKQIAIITDNEEYSKNLAKTIASIINGIPAKGCSVSGYDVSILGAEKFSATDILPASIFFIGCETPKPASFSYIDELFQHINFAGRSCGVFSSEHKALQYLEKIVSNTEASITSLPVMGEKTETELKSWVQSVIERNRL